MQQTIALFQHSLDSMHTSALACIKAGSGIAELAQNQMRTLVDYARRNADFEAKPTAQEFTRRLLDHDFHAAARDTCVLATGQLIEAHATVLDAAKSVIDCSHAWLLGRIAVPAPSALAIGDEVVADAAPDSAEEEVAPRARRKSAS